MAGLLALGGGSAYAQTSELLGNLPSTTNRDQTNGNAWRAVSVMSPTTEELVDVTVTLSRAQATGVNPIVELFSDSSGVPGSAILSFTTTQIAPVLNPGGADISFTPVSPFTFLPGSKYWLVVRAGYGADAGNTYRPAGSLTGIAAGAGSTVLRGAQADPGPPNWLATNEGMAFSITVVERLPPPDTTAPRLRITRPSKSFKYRRSLTVSGKSTEALQFYQAKWTGGRLKTIPGRGSKSFKVKVPRSILKRKRAVTVKVRGADAAGNVSRYTSRRYKRR